MVKQLTDEYIKLYGKRKAVLLRAALCYFRVPRFRVRVLVRKCVACGNKNRHLRKKLQLRYGVEIGSGCVIGEGLSLPHYNGIVIGEGTVIGDNCTIYQQVTLGQKNGGYPVLGNNVTVYPGARIIGNIRIGDNAVIGANAVVLNDVEEGQTVAGVPARVISAREIKNDKS